MIAKISSRQDVADTIVSKGPDVCWTPRGDSWVKVAYTTIGFMDESQDVSTSVRNNGNHDFQLNSRCYTTYGHEAGVGKGVQVPGYKGMAFALSGASFFFSEGFATISHGDPAWVNRPDRGSVEPLKGSGEGNI